MKKFRLPFLVFQLILWTMAYSHDASFLAKSNRNPSTVQQEHICFNQSTILQSNLPVSNELFAQNIYVDNNDDENDQDSTVFQSYAILSDFCLPVFSVATVRLSLPHVIIKEPSIYIFLHAFRL